LGVQLIEAFIMGGVKKLELLRGQWQRSRRRIATTGVILLIATLGYHVLLGANGVLVYAEKRSEYKKLDAEIKALHEENERLNQHIKALRTDPKAIEKEAREQLRYTRPGEVVYTVPEEQPKTHSAEQRKP
jgi:cell division protein FtsB